MNFKNNNPLVSFILLSYNNEMYIKEAVLGAIRQDYENLEIIISDDCSTDGSYQIIRDTVAFNNINHNILIRNNDVNIGLSSHYNLLMNLCRGEIIVIAAGDDISLPKRVSKTVELFKLNPKASFVSFSDIIINKNGEIIRSPKNASENFLNINLSDLLKNNRFNLSAASRGVKRGIFLNFGSLLKECPTEDSTTMLRGLMMGEAVISSEPGILYRVHGENLSSSRKLNNMNFLAIKNQYINDIRKAFALNLINNYYYCRLLMWVERDYKQRIIFSNLFYSKHKFLFWVKEILPNSNLLIKFKISSLISIFLRM